MGTGQEQCIQLPYHSIRCPQQQFGLYYTHRSPLGCVTLSADVQDGSGALTLTDPQRILQTCCDGKRKEREREWR